MQGSRLSAAQAVSEKRIEAYQRYAEPVSELTTQRCAKMGSRAAGFAGKLVCPAGGLR